MNKVSVRTSGGISGVGGKNVEKLYRPTPGDTSFKTKVGQVVGAMTGVAPRLVVDVKQAIQRSSKVTKNK
jgi:hypothetical protein